MEMILSITGAIILVTIFVFIGYQSSRYNRKCDILDEQFNADYETTRHLMSLCIKVDAAKLIDKFYDRWHGLIPEWVICAYVMQLRNYLEHDHKSPVQITFNQTHKN